MLPLIAKRNEIATASQQVVQVIGTYVEVDVRKKQKPPTQYVGHAAIKLADGTLVFLEPIWSKEAIRPLDERKTFNGKQVIAMGTLHARAPQPPEPAATIVSPCLRPVESVSLITT